MLPAEAGYPRPVVDPLLQYEQLLQKVDAHAARVTEAHGAELACRPGCSGCCHRSLTVFPLEAARIAAWVAQEGLAEPTEGDALVHPLTVVADSEPCAFLDPAGRCRVYPVRPLICRSHGLPLAVPEGDGLRGDVCPLNFEGGLGGVPSSDFLSLATLNTVLAALNAAFVASTGVRDVRMPLAELAP